MVNVVPTLSTKVKRGQESWAYIYVALGFVLSFEGTVIQLITPLHWPFNLLAYVVTFVFTSCLFLRSRRFQNKLFGLKRRYEDTYR
jgi:hypothetical protein